MRILYVGIYYWSEISLFGISTVDFPCVLIHNSIILLVVPRSGVDIVSIL